MTVSPAQAAFERGAYAEARRLLGEPQSGDDARLALLIAQRERNWTAIGEAARALVQCGGDYAKLGRVYEAYAELATGEKSESPAPPLERGNNRELDGEIIRGHALIAWMQGRRAETRRLLALTTPATPTLRVQFTELRAWCTPHDARAPMLLNALTLAIEHGVDVGLTSIIAHHVAVLARETNIANLAGRARDLLGAIAWRDLTTDERFFAERAYAWLLAQDGDYITALYNLDQLLQRAATPQQRALAAVDRARVCRLNGDNVNTSVAARHALDAFESLAWTSPQNDMPLALYGSVDVLVREDAERARALVERADVAMLTPALGALSSPILGAYRDLAHAQLTESKLAIDLARRAYRSFKDAHYDYRAAAAALVAYDRTHAAHWREKVADYVEHHPRSPLARDLAWRQAPLQRVTPRRRAILERVAAHETNREIAIALGLTENTVKEHVRVLHRIFNVSKRSELASAWTALLHAA